MHIHNCHSVIIRTDKDDTVYLTRSSKTPLFALLNGLKPLVALSDDVLPMTGYQDSEGRPLLKEDRETLDGLLLEYRDRDIADASIYTYLGEAHAQSRDELSTVVESVGGPVISHWKQWRALSSELQVSALWELCRLRAAMRGSAESHMAAMLTTLGTYSSTSRWEALTAEWSVYREGSLSWTAPEWRQRCILFSSNEDGEGQDIVMLVSHDHSWVVIHGKRVLSEEGEAVNVKRQQIITCADDDEVECALRLVFGEDNINLTGTEGRNGWFDMIGELGIEAWEGPSLSPLASSQTLFCCSLHGDAPGQYTGGESALRERAEAAGIEGAKTLPPGQLLRMEARPVRGFAENIEREAVASVSDSEARNDNAAKLQLAKLYCTPGGFVHDGIAAVPDRLNNSAWIRVSEPLNPYEK